MWNDIQHFKPSEFDSPDAPGSGSRMKKPFVRKLDQLRKAVGAPLRINSGYRTVAHNKKVDGKKTSAHLEGSAADIAVKASHKRHKILREAYKIGFRRVGIADTFVHLDDSKKLPQDRTWTY